MASIAMLLAFHCSPQASSQPALLKSVPFCFLLSLYKFLISLCNFYICLCPISDALIALHCNYKRSPRFCQHFCHRKEPCYTDYDLFFYKTACYISCKFYTIFLRFPELFFVWFLYLVFLCFFLTVKLKGQHLYDTDYRDL